jgi:hypothetical protein
VGAEETIVIDTGTTPLDDPSLELSLVVPTTCVNEFCLAHSFKIKVGTAVQVVLCVPRIPSTVLTSRVALSAVGS